MVDKTRRKVIHPNHVGVKLILAFFSSPHAGYVPFFTKKKKAPALSVFLSLWIVYSKHYFNSIKYTRKL